MNGSDLIMEYFAFLLILKFLHWYKIAPRREFLTNLGVNSISKWLEIVPKTNNLEEKNEQFRL